MKKIICVLTVLDAKKGYNADTPEDIEYYAKKAMNYAEEGKNYYGSCSNK